MQLHKSSSLTLTLDIIRETKKKTNQVLFSFSLYWISDDDDDAGNHSGNHHIHDIQHSVLLPVINLKKFENQYCLVKFV